MPAWAGCQRHRGLLYTTRQRRMGSWLGRGMRRGRAGVEDRGDQSVYDDRSYLYMMNMEGRRFIEEEILNDKFVLVMHDLRSSELFLDLILCSCPLCSCATADRSSPNYYDTEYSREPLANKAVQLLLDTSCLVSIAAMAERVDEKQRPIMSSETQGSSASDGSAPNGHVGPYAHMFLSFWFPWLLNRDLFPRPYLFLVLWFFTGLVALMGITFLLQNICEYEDHCNVPMSSQRVHDVLHPKQSSYASML